MNKIYKCCICHKVLDDKPIRLVKQLYNIGRYKQYSNVDYYDICKSCYRVFHNWIVKHRKEDNNVK